MITHRHGIIKNWALRGVEALNVAPDELLEALKDPEKASRSTPGTIKKHPKQWFFHPKFQKQKSSISDICWILCADVCSSFYMSFRVKVPWNLRTQATFAPRASPTWSHKNMRIIQVHVSTTFATCTTTDKIFPETLREPRKKRVNRIDHVRSCLRVTLDSQYRTHWKNRTWWTCQSTEAILDVHLLVHLRQL